MYIHTFVILYPTDIASPPLLFNNAANDRQPKAASGYSSSCRILEVTSIATGTPVSRWLCTPAIFISHPVQYDVFSPPGGISAAGRVCTRMVKDFDNWVVYRVLL